MGKNPQISATIPAHVNEAIEHRAAILRDSKSNYLAAIAVWWFGQGCPAVRPDEKHLADELKKRLKPVPADLDVWHLNPIDVYSITDDKIVEKLLQQLGLPNLFAQAQEHDEIRFMVGFDNHPTHWLVFNVYKGTGRKDGDGLSFEAYPKSDTPKGQMLARLRRDAAEMEASGEFNFSQIPPLPAKSTNPAMRPAAESAR